MKYLDYLECLEYPVHQENRVCRRYQVCQEFLDFLVHHLGSYKCQERHRCLDDRCFREDLFTNINGLY